MKNRNSLGTVTGRHVPLNEKGLGSQMMGVNSDLQLQKLA